ncbi:hypothetical protein [Asticcacaulis sp.]|uniref:hypothetical protein n=1 Tax=Asticcacaulis sp. TaxID=1872648 RepID=UPI00391C526E
MEIGEDARELIAILMDEGYGVIAGELLTELSLGRERLSTQAKKELFQTEEFDDEPVRDPIPEADQVAFACDFLRQRLVEPVMHLAEAERLASGLIAEPGKALGATEAVRIAFQRPVQDGHPVLSRSEGAGITESAVRLADALAALADYRELKI